MPAATTTGQLFDQLQKSGLFPPGRLEEYAAGLAPGESPRAVLDGMVAAGMLTRFQAERLEQGKYRGFVLGGYVILDRIGGGGMGQVYLAEHAAMRRHVAVKVLASAGAPETVARERFLREARSAAGLNHPNIIRVFDLRQERTVLYLVMEYVAGLSLHHLVSRTGPLDVRAAAHYVRQVAVGLHHAHTNGLVHRDIKPANLLLAQDGMVKILDLGLVRSEADAADKLTSKLDKTILGTADYLAPEQAMDSSAVDTRADVYSLGATFYFLLCGRPLFPDGRTAQKLMWQQLREPTPVRQLRPDIPEGLAAVVHRALRKSPADRFQTPGEMAAALGAWAVGQVPTPDPELLPPPPPRWLGGIATPLGNGTGIMTSSAFLELPAPPALPRTPETMTPTMDGRAEPTPRFMFPPECRTPILGNGPAFASGLSEAAESEVVVKGSRAWMLVAAVGLVVFGATAGFLALWLAGMIRT